MLNKDNVSCFLKKCPWAKSANTTMPLENNLTTEFRNLNWFQQFAVKGKRGVLTL